MSGTWWTAAGCRHRWHGTTELLPCRSRRRRSSHWMAIGLTVPTGRGHRRSDSTGSGWSRRSIAHHTRSWLLLLLLLRCGRVCTRHGATGRRWTYHRRLLGRKGRRWRTHTRAIHVRWSTHFRWTLRQLLLRWLTRQRHVLHLISKLLLVGGENKRTKSYCERICTTTEPFSFSCHTYIGLCSVHAWHRTWRRWSRLWCHLLLRLWPALWRILPVRQLRIHTAVLIAGLV